MKLAHALLLCYIAAVAVHIATAAGNGNINGNGNVGSGNGGTNGNYNTGAGNGNTNGNLNLGSLNGNGNGNGNLGFGNGNGNGNLNSGSGNGNGNGNGNIGSGNGNGNGNGNAGGRGDPIMTGFDGRSFEFNGTAGHYYHIISERHHQLATKLKVGVMWDHNGTYMEGFGFQYRDQTIVMQLNDEDELAVIVNGEPLAMTKGETELEMVPYVEGGELVMLWQKHREGLGNAVELTTDLLQVVVWVTPAGTVDEGGKEQPAYLNFDVALLGPPSNNEMQGIVGETYNRMLAGAAMNDPKSPLYVPDDYLFHGQGPEDLYRMDSYFAEHERSAFGKDRKRVLIESDADMGLVAFPLRAFGRAAALTTAPQPVTIRASGGRKGRFL